MQTSGTVWVGTGKVMRRSHLVNGFVPADAHFGSRGGPGAKAAPVFGLRSVERWRILPQERADSDRFPSQAPFSTPTRLPMREFGPDHYVPLLKGKAGEFAALNSITAYDLRNLTPFIDVPLMQGGTGQATPEQHYAAQHRHLREQWGSRGPVFVDSRLVQAGVRTADGKHPALQLFRQAAEAGIAVVPVGGLRREDAYQESVRAGAALLGHGVCLRLEDADLTPALPSSVVRWLGSLDVEPEQVDLVLDLREVAAGAERSMTSAARMTIATLPFLERWRTFTLASGAFPDPLGSMPRLVPRLLPRVDWSLWRAVAAEMPPEVRRPSFGDYGISHPGMAEFDPRTASVPVALRYTTPADFLVIKAGSFQKQGGRPFRDICATLVAMPAFSGGSFSAGDRYIDECARVPGSSGGNPRKWREVGTSHHLTMVVTQLRGLAGSASSAAA